MLFPSATPHSSSKPIIDFWPTPIDIGIIRRLVHLLIIKRKGLLLPLTEVVLDVHVDRLPIS